MSTPEKMVTKLIELYEDATDHSHAPRLVITVEVSRGTVAVRDTITIPLTTEAAAMHNLVIGLQIGLLEIEKHRKEHLHGTEP